MLSKSFWFGQKQADFRLLLALSAISVTIVLVHLASLPVDVYWWTPDSAAYIEAARSFIQSGDFLISPSLLSENEQEVVKLWPPGYPVLVALGSLLTNLPAEIVSFLIPLICWALLAPLIAYCIVPVGGKGIAVWVAVLSALSPGAISWGWRGLTDLPFLFISVLSIGLFLRSTCGERGVLYAVGAGALAGLGYTFRNVGLALLAASVAAYVLAVVLGRLNKKSAAKLILAFACGSAVFVVPLIWYNIITFGSLQPYRMAPSTVSLLENIRLFIEACILDSTGLYELSNFVAWTWWALIIFFVFCSLAIGILMCKILSNRSFGEADNSTAADIGILMLAFYLLAGAVIVIVARTVYEWGEMISVRHTLQYTWALLAIIFLLISGSKEKRTAAMFIVGGILLFGHLQWALRNYWGSNPEAQLRVEKAQIYASQFLDEKIAQIPADAIVVSNFADVLRIKTRRKVRQLSPGKTSEIAARLSAMQDTRIWEKRIALVLFPYPGGMALDKHDLDAIQVFGFSAWWTDERVSILIKPG